VGDRWGKSFGFVLSGLPDWLVKGDDRAAIQPGTAAF